MVKPTTEARAPQQARSREKYARILTTTARLLETVPYDELGTTQIAAAAGVSVGVLYRYFPDKEAIARELVVGWNQGDVDTVNAVTGGSVPAEPRELIARLLDAFAQRFRDEPGYRKVWYDGPWLTGPEGRDSNAAIAARIHEVLVSAYGIPDTPVRRRRAWLAVETGSHLIGLAFRETPDGDADLLHEASRMLAAYLLAPED